MRARGGGIGFVYPSSQNQLIAETHIVLVLYGLMTGGVIMLSKGSEKLSELGKQARVYAWKNDSFWIKGQKWRI